MPLLLPRLPVLTVTVPLPPGRRHCQPGRWLLGARLAGVLLPAGLLAHLHLREHAQQSALLDQELYPTLAAHAHVQLDELLQRVAGELPQGMTRHVQAKRRMTTTGPRDTQTVEQGAVTALA